MFKLALKIAACSLVVLGIGLVMTNNKVYANTPGACPSTFEDAESRNWGVSPGYNGSHGGAMAGMIVHAYDANTKQDLTTQYHLNSRIYDDVPHPGTAPNGEHVKDLNDAIYADVNGIFYNRQSEHQSYTGGGGAFLYNGGSDNFIECTGWDAFGPADLWEGQKRVGNTTVLDCGPLDNPTQFWFTNISNPRNDNISNTNGYWSVQVVYGDQDHPHGSSLYIEHYTEGSMRYRNNSFRVANGYNTYVNLIWHPVKDTPQNVEATGQCQHLFVDENVKGGKGRVWVSVTGVSVGKLKYTADNNDVAWFPGPTGNDRYGDPGKPGRPQNITSWVGPGEAGGDTDKHVSKEWWFQPNANSITVTVRRDTISGSTWTNGDVYYLGNDGGWTKTPTSINCFSAQCNNPLTVVGDVPGSRAVLADGNMYITGSYTNNGFLDLWNPALGDNRGNVYGIGYPVVTAGQTVTFSIVLPAPGYDPNNPFALTLTPGYFGSFPASTACSASVPVYTSFNIDPYANVPTGSEENTQEVTYKTGGNKTAGPDTTPVTTSWLTKEPFGTTPGGSPVDTRGTNDRYGSASHTYTYNNTSINAGDKFCSHITINPANGYVGPGGSVLGGNPVTKDSASCLKTVNKPYTHFTGNDVSAGGGFGNCTASTSSKGVIYGYNEAQTGIGAVPIGAAGTGSQFGAHAMSVISGFGTANMRDTAPTGLSGLAFANTERIGGTSPSRTTGGYLGKAALNNFCQPDYFGNKSSDVKEIDGSSVSAGDTTKGDKQWYKMAPGTTFELNSGTIANGVKQTIFVEGNVEIKGDIKYDSAAPDSVSKVPSFFLIVKNGNIRIDPGVKRLDGAYIAQPGSDLDKTGLINTCWVGNDTNSIYTQCKNQLVVNGAFVANRILLTRSHSSLRYSKGGENNLGSFPAHTCGDADKDVPAGGPTSASDCAAEIFNFSPELYLSQPAFNIKYGAPTGKFDAVTSLSPVL